MRQSKAATKFTPLEVELALEGERLRGLGLELLGFLGGPKFPALSLGRTLSRRAEDAAMFREEWDFANEAQVDAARTQALIRGGLLRRAARELIDGLFDDHGMVQILAGEENELYSYVAGDSSILHLLPESSALQYDDGFVRKLIVLASDLSTKMEGGWSGASCLAQELLVYCMTLIAEALGKQLEVTDDDDYYDYLSYLVEDTDFLLLYDSSPIPPEFAAMAAESIGAVNLGIDSWFEPFTSDRPVAGYVHLLGQQSDDQQAADARAALRITESFPGAQRTKALQDGTLVDLTEDGEDRRFLCPVAAERQVLEALSAGRPMQKTASAVLEQAAEAADRAAKAESVDLWLSGEDGTSADAVLVLGRGPRGALRLTVQRAPEKPSYQS